MIKLKLLWHRIKSAWWMFCLEYPTREKILSVGVAIQAGDAIKHDTVWGRGVCIKENSEDKYFFFVSFNTDTSIRSHSLLDKDLPLCTTDLGEGYCTDKGLK